MTHFTPFDDMRRKFSNHRQWRDFVAAVQDSVTYPCSATYPMVLSALRSGKAWFSDGAARATNWLSGAGDDGGALQPNRT
ncbi:MAG: hypothetical protein WBF89_05855 [Steroidobacteraceae bacterium]